MPPSSWFANLQSGWPALAEPQGIGYTAFVATTLDDVLISGDDRLCRAVFDLLDAGRDGTICATDLHKRLGLSKKEAELVVLEASSQLGNVDPALGLQGLNFSTFLSLMRKEPTRAESNTASQEKMTAVLEDHGRKTKSVRMMFN
jgi:hypothetical protein